MNSPETVLYTKGRMLYGLHLTKAADQTRSGYAVMVEGYFDFAQALQAGVKNPVATCGTARDRPTGPASSPIRVERSSLSFDPDTAGQKRVRALWRTTRRATGLQVNVAVLEARRRSRYSRCALTVLRTTWTSCRTSTAVPGIRARPSGGAT